MRPAMIAAGLGLAAAWWSARSAATTAPPGPAAPSLTDMLKTALADATPFALAIALPGNAAYVAKLREVEAKTGIPVNMLVRLAWQESRFREDIITGRTKSSAGAAGMMRRP